jgi:hypothetical protein
VDQDDVGVVHGPERRAHGLGAGRSPGDDLDRGAILGCSAAEPVVLRRNRHYDALHPRLGERLH